MYGIIRSESCSTVEKLVTFQTVWQAATYWAYASKKLNRRKLYALMTMLAPRFLFIVFFLVVWLFANPIRRKSNLFCAELLEVLLARLKQKNTCRSCRFHSSLRSNHTQYVLQSTDQQKCQSYPIDGRYISSLYPENPVHPVKNSCPMN